MGAVEVQLLELKAKLKLQQHFPCALHPSRQCLGFRRGTVSECDYCTLAVAVICKEVKVDNWELLPHQGRASRIAFIFLFWASRGGGGRRATSVYF